VTVYVRDAVYSTHRVVTTVPTQITNTTARCNGVAIIANGVYSTGYFEYGISQNLGYTTNNAAIGNQNSTAFGNTLSGLSPNTTYYCRAVMSNADGIYRGEIMSFRTTGSRVIYTPVTTVTTIKHKTVVKKQVICQDVTGNKESITTGQKLVNITIDKTTNTLNKGEASSYKVHYQNTSRLVLTNVIVKVTIPEDMNFTDMSRGTYNSSDRTMTIDLGTLNSLQSGDIVLPVQISKDVQVGKTVIATAYISYELLDEDGNTTKEENTSYVISTISNSQATDVTKTESQSDIFPSTILEWLAIIVLIGVLIVLGRAIYMNLVGDKSHNTHGH
jgi:hypothetical protein